MKTYGNESLRVAFGEAIAAAGDNYEDLRVLDAGTSNSTSSIKFAKKFPERFYTLGINEPGMLGLASGVAMAGKRVIACDMSVFLHHAYAQIRATARQGDDMHFILATTHTGVSVGPDGGSAHDLTDMARMRLIPNFNVLTPWDGNHVRKIVDIILKDKGYYYVRLNRPGIPIFTDKSVEFEVGKAYKLMEGERVTIIAVGDKVYPALKAAEQLGEGYADVIGISTLEPLDSDTILKSVKRTGKVVTIEDHVYIGGLFESVAGLLAQHNPTPIKPIALERKFTESGDPLDLLKMYGLDVDSIVKSCHEFVETKS